MTDSRAKGNRFELFVESVLKMFFPDARRMGGTQARDQKYADIEGTPFRLEAKHWKTISYNKLRKWMDKVLGECEKYEDDRVPVLITKVDYQKDPFVILTLSNFCRLIEKHFWSPPEEGEVIPIRPLPPQEEEEPCED